MNTCIHSASHGTVNSVNTRSAYLPLCISHPHPSAALAPSRLAARRPRSRRPGRARRPSRRSCPSRCPTSPPAPCSRRAGPSPSGGAPWRGSAVSGGEECQIQMYARIHCIQPCMQPRLTYMYHTSAYVCHIRMHHLGHQAHRSVISGVDRTSYPS